jgi:hypothetical protein
MANETAPANQSDDQIVKTLISTHEEVAVYKSAKFGLFVFRPPDLDEWEDLVVKIQKGPDVARAARRDIAQRTLVHGSVDALQRLFERRPALATTIGERLGDLAGMHEEVEVKKG